MSENIDRTEAAENCRRSLGDSIIVGVLCERGEKKEGIPPLLTIIVDVLCERGEKKEGHSSSANNYCGCTV